MSGGGGVWEELPWRETVTERRGPGPEQRRKGAADDVWSDGSRVRRQGQATGGASLVAAGQGQTLGLGARRKGLATVW